MLKCDVLVDSKDLRANLLKLKKDETLSVDTVSDIFPSANWAEREAYDQYGVIFLNHPNLKRVLNHKQFVGHPLRKDYKITQGQICTETDDLMDEMGPLLKSKGYTDEEIADLMLLNVGPSHPASHGTIRNFVALEGETIAACVTEIGYLHRGFEKACEHHTYSQVIPYTDRLNYCSAILNNIGWAKAIEEMLNIEITPRAKMIRVVIGELSRIIDHFVCNAANMVDLGGLTSLWYLFGARDLLYSMECHDGISDWIEELNSIKKKERDNGIKMGKKREYFKKGTWEYERKKYLKQEIKKYEDENYEFKSIKQQIADIKQQITNIESGSSMYDTTLGALFVRVSDIMNDLIGKAKVSGEANGNIDYSCFSLKNLTISIEVLNSDEEKVFLDVIMNEALMCKQRGLSDEVVLNLIVESANKYKCLECSNTEKGKQIPSTLREFWSYKHNQCSSFSIPANLVVLKSLMAFFIKPFGFDQIDRYAQNRGIDNKEYGYMLRGALI